MSGADKMRLRSLLSRIGPAAVFGMAVLFLTSALWPHFAGTAAAGSSTNENADVDYSHFQHREPQHLRLPCLLCHRRDDRSTRPKLSGHLPCAGCHVQQFADNSSPICTICHVQPSSGVVRAFPRLTGFSTRFDHGKHVRQTNCTSCHRQTNGAGLSIPTGSGAHAACFQCHGPTTEIGGKNIGSCGTCHVPGNPVRTSLWAKAFQMSFRHDRHLAKREMNCSSCHVVRAGGGRGRQVSSPEASMHFADSGKASCSTCHNGRRAFGANDFANCKRCHTKRTFAF